MSVASVSRTLRFRLAMWNAVAVALVAAISIFVVHRSTHWALMHTLDELLVQDAEEIELALTDFAVGTSTFRDDLDRKALGHRRHEWFVKLFDADKQLVWKSVNAPEQIIGPLTDTPTYFASSTGYRYFTRTVNVNRSIRWIRVGASLDPLEQELERIDRVALLVWLLSLVFAPLIGWSVSGRALRPLSDMVQTATVLRPDYLGDRLPIRGADDELDQLALTMNRLLDRIAAVVGEKQDFLANAAHELRTPLAAIRTTAEVALVADRTVEEYQELVAQVVEQADHLSSIVNQLLLLAESSLPAQMQSREPVRLDQIVRKSAEILKVIAEAKQVSLRVDRADEVTLAANRDQWIQVLNNLIGNAIKFTPSGGRVSIDLRQMTTRDDKPIARLTVSDTGVGIAADDLERVFERFYRTESHSEFGKASGSGLGLSICRAVVQGHHGQITCDSSPGKGTRLTIEVPLCNAESVL